MPWAALWPVGRLELDNSTVTVYNVSCEQVFELEGLQAPDGASWEPRPGGVDKGPKETSPDAPPLSRRSCTRADRPISDPSCWGRGAQECVSDTEHCSCRGSEDLRYR